MERPIVLKLKTCFASLLLAIVAVIVCGCPETPSRTKVVEPATTPSTPDGVAATKPITLEAADPAGLQAILDKHRGKVVVVDFWATWCIPCLQAFPHTLELGHKYADKGLVIISVCMMEPEEDTKQKALAKLKELKADCINLISALGGEEAAYDAFDIVPLPTYKIYGRDGKLARTFDNTDVDHPFDHTDVEAEVRKLLGL
ncbi:MAG: TlpA disulfide reductase family protein [Planctomycetaceae bacterium]